MESGCWTEALFNGFGLRSAQEPPFNRSVAVPFVIPSEAEGSAVLRTRPGKEGANHKRTGFKQILNTFVECVRLFALNIKRSAAIARGSDNTFEIC